MNEMSASQAPSSEHDLYWDPNRLTLWLLPRNAKNGEWTDYEVKSDSGEAVISGKLPYDVGEVRAACALFHDRCRTKATLDRVMSAVHHLPLSKQERIRILEDALMVVRETKEEEKS